LDSCGETSKKRSSCQKVYQAEGLSIGLLRRDKYIVAGLQPAGTDVLALKRSVAPSFDIKGFQPLL